MDVGSAYGSYYETAKSYMGLREGGDRGICGKGHRQKSGFPEDKDLRGIQGVFLMEKMNPLYTHPSQRE